MIEWNIFPAICVLWYIINWTLRYKFLFSFQKISDSRNAEYEKKIEKYLEILLL